MLKRSNLYFAGAVIGLVLLAAPGHAATLPARQPGLWQSTTTVTDASGKILSGGARVISVSCVDAATDIKFFVSRSSGCSKIAVLGSGNAFSIDSSCTNAGKPLTIHEDLVYVDAENVTLNAVYHAPSGVINITSALAYQGPCPAGMMPGDEGSLQNGTFSKTDNINDSDNR